MARNMLNFAEQKHLEAVNSTNPETAYKTPEDLAEAEGKIAKGKEDMDAFQTELNTLDDQIVEIQID
jgi:hypothetical protein